MEVLSCSDVQYVGESNCPQRAAGTNFLYNEDQMEHGKEAEVSDITHKVDGEVVNAEWSKKDGLFEEKEGVYLGTSYSEHMEEGEALTCSLNSQKQNNEPCIASKISLNVKNIEGELPSFNKDRESHLPEAEWLEPDETVALWVKWRGKWQAGIRCARADCPLSTLKARPTHDRKKYFVVFFPQTRNYSWADTLLVRPIHEFPDPIAHRTHKRGRDKVKDLSLPRRFIIQKLAIGMLNVSDQLHNEAVIESAREVTAWKEFAMEASRCKVYQDLGRVLLKLHSMILKQYVYPDWLENSFDSWTKRCQNAPSAESIETLKEEMVNSIMWNEVEALWDAPVQPELGSEWKTWKQEAMKWFSTSHPIARSFTDVAQRHSGNSESIGQQTSRKRAKLVVRRAEMHASQVEVGTLHETHPQTNIVEIDSGYFNSQGIGIATTSVPDPCNTERAAPSVSPGRVTNRWDGIVVEVENSRLNQTTGMEEIPGDGGSSRKPLNPGNKYRQCMSFIEAKGRQCVRWANEDDVYCCVHLPTRSFGKAANAEQTPTKDSPMCEGTTTHGTKCKHRSRYGSSFCKKHGLHESQYLMDMKKQSSSLGNTLKRKHMETILSTETALGKEIVLFQDGQMPIQENSVSLVELENLDERNSIQVYNSSEALQCIGLCNENNSAPCLDPAKLHSLYCEKHLPIWLKRARNGKSRIISKEIFTDLLRNCDSQNQKLHLHQACGILYGFIKSILSRRNPLSKETQLQWILSEASKDLCVGECLLKLVSREREKLMMLWGFDIDKVKPISSVGVEQSVLVPVVRQSSNNIQNVVKCKICTGEFLDDQALGSHWMDIHKKEAQRLYRGYACALCMDSFIDKKVLETHVMVKHEMQYLEQCILFQCIPCGSHFMNPSQLWSHVLTVHSKDFKLPTIAEEHIFSANQVSTQLELGNNSSERNSESKGAGRFICKFCGLKFDLLPDLGRHHQAAHMSLTSINHIYPKRGTHVNPFKLKSGKLSHPSFTKGLGVATASYRIRNRNRSNLRLKKRFRASNPVSTVGLRIQSQVAEGVGLGRLAESQCSSVAKILFSEIQKTKPHPSNLDILSVARSTCCKISLQAALEEQFGVLPERLYLKAAKLCSELNIQVTWHNEGFICPKGCKPVKDSNTLSPLMPLPIGSMELTLAKIDDPMNIEEWEMDECHYIIESRHIKSRPMSILLCEDVSVGRESVAVTCAVDDNVVGSINGFKKEGSNGKITGFPVPWEGFTYVTERLVDPSLGLDIKSSQLGCACPHLTCSPEACDHVYLFDNDYENAEDINGQPMHGRFPYDERGRIILKEGYLVYECNSLCSCDRTCRNRVLQNGVKVKLEVFKTDNKGWAVRAGEPILRGSFVCEYIGEVINDQEASNRGVSLDNEGCSYLYDINAHIDVMSELDEGTVSYLIDATRYGNVSRFMNHSCSPNLASYLVLVENMDHQLAHIGFYASRDIAKGEELAYDYRRKLQTGEGHPCCCGAPNCRGLY